MIKEFINLSPKDISLAHKDVSGILKESKQIYAFDAQKTTQPLNTYERSTYDQVTRPLFNKITPLSNKVLKVHEEWRIRANRSAAKILRESLILHHLHHAGITNIPQVLDSQGGWVLMNQQTYPESGHNYTSLLLARINAEDWYDHRFKSETQVIQAGIKAAGILKQIYEAGYIHNDVKPGNLLIDADENVYVIDFDNAEKHVKGRISSYEGTQAYAAPERLSPQILTQEDTDVRADIYSLALTLADCMGISSDCFDHNNDDFNEARYRFVKAIEKHIYNGRITRKLAIFICFNTSRNPSLRSQNYTEFIEVLESCLNPDVTPKMVYDHFNEKLSPNVQKKTNQSIPDNE